MLCLSVDAGEATHIFLPDGRLIKIYAERRRNSRRVLLSIDAPKDVLILREELVEVPNVPMPPTPKV